MTTMEEEQNDTLTINRREDGFTVIKYKYTGNDLVGSLTTFVENASLEEVFNLFDKTNE